MHLEPVNFDEYLSSIKKCGIPFKTLETIQYEGKDYDILQLDANSDAEKRLLIFAGVHGNEFAAALAVIDLLEDIKKNPSFYASWHVQIITPLNPVGLAYQSRYNELGRDINRDFKEYATVGGTLQKRVIESFKPDFLISLHEGPQNGFFIIAEGATPKHLKKRLTEALNAAGVKLASKSFLRNSITPGYWQKGRVTYFIQKLLGIYTLGRYTYEHKTPELTTESPWADENVLARRKPHLVTIQTVVTSL